MTIRHWRLWRIIPILIAVAAATLSTPASAAAADPPNPYCTFSGSFQGAFNFGTINVPRNAAVGSTIGPTLTASLAWNCPVRGSPPRSGSTAGYSLLEEKLNGVADPNNPDLAATGIPGIGVYMAVAGGLLVNGASSVNFNGIYQSQISGIWADVPYSTTVAQSGTTILSINLVKTGAVTGGGTFNLPSIVSVFTEMQSTARPDSTRSPIGTISGIIAIPSCSTSNVTVTLPTVSPANLTPVGQTAGATPFTINLNCPAGIPGGVFMTLTDSTAPGNRSANLSLASGSTASGVAVRITNSLGSVAYGLDSVAAANPGQFKVGTLTSAAGTINVPLTASYISTGAVTAGAVKAIATFTMSYQ